MTKIIDFDTFDPEKLKVMDIEGVDPYDVTELCDAYVTEATYNGNKISDDELEELFTLNPGYEAELIFDYMN